MPIKTPGTEWRDSRGQVFVYLPKRKSSRKSDGSIARSRLVMEDHLGRYLTHDERVLHRNGKVDDDDIDNLMLFPSREAMQDYIRAENAKKRKPTPVQQHGSWEGGTA